MRGGQIMEGEHCGLTRSDSVFCGVSVSYYSLQALKRLFKFQYQTTCLRATLFYSSALDTTQRLTLELY